MGAELSFCFILLVKTHKNLTALYNGQFLQQDSPTLMIVESTADQPTNVTRSRFIETFARDLKHGCSPSIDIRTNRFCSKKVHSDLCMYVKAWRPHLD